MQLANLALRFVVELVGVAAVAYAAFQISDNALVRVLATVAAPLVFIVAWTTLVAPNTANGLAQPQKDIIGTVLLLLAAAALGVAGQGRLAAFFASVVLANVGLLFAFGNDAAPAVPTWLTLGIDRIKEVEALPVEPDGTPGKLPRPGARPASVNFEQVLAVPHRAQTGAGRDRIHRARWWDDRVGSPIRMVGGPIVGRSLDMRDSCP